MKLIVVTLILLSVVSLTSSFPWKPCPNTDSSRLEVTAVNIDPTPIIKGKAAKFQTIGNAKQNLSQKNGRLEVYQGGTRFFSTAVGGSYSVNQGGKYDYSFSYTIPSFVPPGDYEVRLSYVDTNSQAFTCVSVLVHF